MSKDIRSFFTTIGGSKKKEDTPSNLGINPHKNSNGTKKRVVVLSDSDDDDNIIPSSTKKRSKVQSVPDEITPKNVIKKQAPVLTASKPKLVNPMDIFGTQKVKRSSEVTPVTTTQKEEVEVPKKKKKTKGAADAVAGWDESFSDLDFLSTLGQLDAIEAQATKIEEKKPSEIIKAEDTTVKINEENGKTSLTFKIKGKAPENLENSKRSSEKSENLTKSERKSSKRDEADKHADEIIEVEVPTKKDKSKTHKKDKNDSGPSTESKEKISDSEETPANESSVLEGEDDVPSWVNDPQEKRRLSAMGYQRYLAREGPKNLGLKEIPKGKPDCLKGLVFVISGVLDSLEREAAAELIQECGGKVTSSVSRNTSYIVLGEDAGPSKVQKAKQFGTKQLDEDGLLDLIRSKSGILITTKPKSPPKETKTTSSYFDKTSESSVADKNIDKKKKAEADNKQFSTGVNTKTFYGKTSVKDKKDTSSMLLAECNTKEDCAAVKPSSNVADSKTFSRKPSLRDKPESPSSQTAAKAAPAEATESLMWVDKYRPTNTKQIIGQQGAGSNLKKLTKWLENWHCNQISGKKLEKPNPWATNDDGAFFKAALLSGPPGIGKTTTAHLVCKELGFDVVEFNASDTRSKKLLHNEVSELLSNKSLYQFFQGSAKGTSSKHVLLMDEIDGMSGNEDRGGINELIQLIKNSKVPIICMCNDRNHQKLRSLIGHCFDLKFSKPRVEQIRGAMMSVCFKEGVKMSPDILSNMIIGSSQDVRQVLHHLSMYAAKETPALSKDSPKEEVKQIKNIKLGPWDVVVKVFSAEDHKKMSINDKSDLFFFDYNISPLFVQENYLQVAPDAAKSIYKRLDLISEAADSICWGDVVEKTVRSKQAWALLPTQAMFSSVIPGDLLEGRLTGQTAFPQWLGKNSRRGRFDRLLQELHVHTRLSTSGNKQSLNLDYLPAIRDGIMRPLVQKGPEGIPEAINVMQSYHLMRADLDNILEISVWSKEKNPIGSLDTKVKTAFTRAFNKDSALLPYSTAMAVSKSKASAVSSNYEGENDEEEGAEEEREDDDDIAGDAMIKVMKKAAPKKESAFVGKKVRGSRASPGGSKGKGGKGKAKSKC